MALFLLSRVRRGLFPIFGPETRKKIPEKLISGPMFSFSRATPLEIISNRFIIYKHISRWRPLPWPAAGRSGRLIYVCTYGY
jgi:hypothetical protein